MDKKTQEQYEKQLAGYAELITKLGQENKKLKTKQVQFDTEWYDEVLKDISMLAFAGLEDCGEHDVTMRAIFRAIETNCAVARVFINDDESYLETINSAPKWS
jgi:malate synthase